MTHRLPTTGPLPAPVSPEEGREVMRAEAFEARDIQMVSLLAADFTSLCPRTRQPDFGAVVVEYTPNRRCLESKSLKYYLWSYRDVGGFCEEIAARIADDIVFAIEPKALTVRLTQNIRGGITITATAERMPA